MATPLKLIMVNAADSAALTTAPAAAASLPADNLKNVSRSRVVRVMATNQVDILGTWPAGKHISGLALYRHNLTAAALWRIRFYSGPDQSGEVIYDSGELPALAQKLFAELDFGIDNLVATVFDGWDAAFSQHWLPTDVVARSFALTLKDPGNPAGYLQAQRLYIGRALSPSVNFSYGHELSWVDPSKSVRTDGGSVWTEKRPKYRRLSFRLEHLTEHERPYFMEALRTVGTSQDFFLAAFPDDTGMKGRDYAFAAKFVNNPGITGARFNQFQTPFDCEEV